MKLKSTKTLNFKKKHKIKKNITKNKIHKSMFLNFYKKKHKMCFFTSMTVRAPRKEGTVPPPPFPTATSVRDVAVSNATINASRYNSAMAAWLHDFAFQIAAKPLQMIRPNIDNLGGLFYELVIVVSSETLALSFPFLK